MRSRANGGASGARDARIALLPAACVAPKPPASPVPDYDPATGELRALHSKGRKQHVTYYRRRWTARYDQRGEDTKQRAAELLHFPYEG